MLFDRGSGVVGSIDFDSDLKKKSCRQSLILKVEPTTIHFVPWP